MGNEKWDAAEIYFDSNANNNWDNGEPLYQIGEKPINFLVDYSEEYTASCDYENIYDKCSRPFFKFSYHEKDTAKTDTITIFTHYDGAGIPQFETYHSLIEIY